MVVDNISGKNKKLVWEPIFIYVHAFILWYAKPYSSLKMFLALFSVISEVRSSSRLFLVIKKKKS